MHSYLHVSAWVHICTELTISSWKYIPVLLFMFQAAKFTKLLNKRIKHRNIKHENELIKTTKQKLGNFLIMKEFYSLIEFNRDNLQYINICNHFISVLSTRSLKTTIGNNSSMTAFTIKSGLSRPFLFKIINS